jgi:hypothetical protein
MLATCRQLARLLSVLRVDFEVEREPLQRSGAYLKPYLAPHRVQREAGDCEDNHNGDDGQHDGTLPQPSTRTHALSHGTD